jgi:hypothetical protein
LVLKLADLTWFFHCLLAGLHWVALLGSIPR